MDSGPPPRSDSDAAPTGSQKQLKRKQPPAAADEARASKSLKAKEHSVSEFDGLTSKAFVKSLKGRALKYQVLITIKSLQVNNGWETKQIDHHPNLPRRKPDDPADTGPHFKLTEEGFNLYRRAQAVLLAKAEDKDFIMETVLRLRSKLKAVQRGVQGKRYLRKEHGYHFPYHYRFDGITYDWWDHESGSDEDTYYHQDPEGNYLYQLRDGSAVFYSEKGIPVKIREPEDRKVLKLDFSSDDSDD